MIFLIKKSKEFLFSVHINNNTSRARKGLDKKLKFFRMEGCITSVLYFLKKLFFFSFALISHYAYGSNYGFADVLEPCIPCVVSIVVEKKGPFEDCPQLGNIPEIIFQEEDSLNTSCLPLFSLSDKSQRCLSAIRFGSGFVIDGKGYIVTNWHVISSALKNPYVIRVLFHDGTERNAQLIGYDQNIDLAVLKVKTGTALPSLSWEASKAPRVGDWVFAGGNPFGLGGTFTSGMVSCAKRKKNQTHDPSNTFWIQTDVPINNGNSGGPLLNTQGKVIGINTEIFSPNGAHVGISFAIPAAIAIPIVEKIKNQKRFQHAEPKIEVTEIEGYSCIALEDVSEKLKKKWSLPSDQQGILVLETPNHQKSLIQPADVILQISLDFVRSPQDFKQKIYNARRRPPGQGAKSLLLLIWRKNKGKFHILFPIKNQKNIQQGDENEAHDTQ